MLVCVAQQRRQTNCCADVPATPRAVSTLSTSGTACGAVLGSAWLRSCLRSHRPASPDRSSAAAPRLVQTIRPRLSEESGRKSFFSRTQCESCGMVARPHIFSKMCGPRLLRADHSVFQRRMGTTYARVQPRLLVRRAFAACMRAWSCEPVCRSTRERIPCIACRLVGYALLSLSAVQSEDSRRPCSGAAFAESVARLLRTHTCVCVCSVRADQHAFSVCVGTLRVCIAELRHTQTDTYLHRR